jgi:hypothetical protein
MGLRAAQFVSRFGNSEQDRCRSYRPGSSAATEMQISINTVSYDMRSLYLKLQVHSKSEAVAKALRDRLIH